MDDDTDASSGARSRGKASCHNTEMSTSKQRSWWCRNKRGDKKREQLRAPLRTLSEPQLRGMAAGVAMEMERRIPKLARAAHSVTVEKARSDSTEDLLRHKDLGRWVGAGL
jgi:hypothetical protein